MGQLAFRTLSGGRRSFDDADLAALRADLRGRTVVAGDPDYDRVRAVWNGMIDRRPALVVRCAGTADVMRCVRFAADNELLVSVRGGGHHIAGMALADDALCIDLSLMREVHVDPERRVARVSGGATLADLDGETQAFGLATPLGINSTTGVAGLALGGGFGWLARRHGLTVDNLLAAEVVLADGRRVRASDDENPDLFWALRGGGGNFGIVTSFEFRLHQVGPQVLCGLVVHPFADAPRVLDEYRRFTDSAPEEVTCWVVLRKAPPLPFLPPEVHGREILIVAMIDSGDLAGAERRLAPMRRAGKPLADVVAPHRYRDWQQAMDPLMTPGLRNYWKSHNFTAFEPGLRDVLLDFARRLPSPHAEVFLGQLGGAAGRVASDAMAYPHRDAQFVMNVHARWEDAADDAKCIGWARDLFRAAGAYATGGVYVNFENEERAAAVYGDNFARLLEMKRRYDPRNLFRVCQNIRPDVPAARAAERPATAGPGAEDAGAHAPGAI